MGPNGQLIPAPPGTTSAGGGPSADEGPVEPGSLPWYESLGPFAGMNAKWHKVGWVGGGWGRGVRAWASAAPRAPGVPAVLKP
jgi:hypothetical protein